MTLKLWINAPWTGSNQIGCGFFHFGQNHILKVIVLVAVKSTQIVMKFIVANFVPFLILTIIRHLFLNCIICEMHPAILHFESVLGGRCSYVALSVPVSLQYAINTCNHHVMPYIEFTLVVEKRFFNIFLNNVGSVGSIRTFLFLLYDALYLLQGFADLYPVPSIWILAWLHNPHVLLLLGFVWCFYLFIFLIVMTEKSEIVFVF